MKARVFGNWKMHKTIGETTQFVHELKKMFGSEPVGVAVPFTAISAAASAASGSSLLIGAQNISEHSRGAYTGEISGKMIKDAKAHFVLVGHSERRHIYAETLEQITAKLQRSLVEGLQPILCVGETAEEHKRGLVDEVLNLQLTSALKGIDPEDLKKIAIVTDDKMCKKSMKINYFIVPADVEPFKKKERMKAMNWVMI